MNEQAMGKRISCSRFVLSAGVLVVLALGLGCPTLPGFVPPPLADTEMVPLSADQSVEVELGAGALGMADSVWAMFKASDDSLVFRAEYGSTGQIERIYDSFLFGGAWLGTQILSDGQSHPAELAGGSYVSGSYVVEQGDDLGVLGVVHWSLLGVHLGTARLTFFGKRDGDRIDGTMFSGVTILADDRPFPTPGDGAFEAYAVREE